MPRKVRMKISPQSFNSMMASSIVSSPELMATSGSKGRTAFQWGGSIFTIMPLEEGYNHSGHVADGSEPPYIPNSAAKRLLLILNRRGQRPSVQTLLLVLSLFTTFPTGLFKIVRGQFGCWVAFLAVAANLFFPEVFPASRFVLFVITPSWLADGLRDSIVGGVFCLIIGLLLLIMEFRRIEGCSHFCFWYFFGIFFLLFFTILYLPLGPW